MATIVSEDLLDLRLSPEEIVADLEAGRSAPLVPAHQRAGLQVEAQTRPTLGGAAFTATWSAVQTLGRVDPRLALPALESLWFTPWTVGRERELPLGATRRTFGVGGTELHGWTLGEGPSVLLVHGWGGRSTDLLGAAVALERVGLRAVAVDMPAHGRSPGRRSNLVEMGEAVRGLGHLLEVETGENVRIVSHSLGGAAAVIAMHQGLFVPRIALIAPPQRLEHAVATFAEQARLTDGLHRVLRRSLEREFGPSVWRDLAVDAMADAINTNALVVHSTDDEQISFEDGRAVARALEGRFVPVEGLGHARILVDKGVLARVVAHVA